MKSILSWLSTPYYFNPSVQFKLRTSFTFGVFVFVFLYIFKPFTLASLEEILFEYTLGIGLITFLGSFFALYAPPLFFKNYFDEDNWTIGKNVFFTIITIFFVGSILWYYGGLYKKERGIANITYVDFLLYTFLVGVLPVFLVIFTNEKNVREKREKRASEIRDQKKKKILEKQKTFKNEIIIYSDNKKEHLKIKIKDLIYITSQGNYASFFIKKDEDTLKEKILRVTLTKIEDTLNDYPNIIRCHKSYIINTSFVSDIKGNARGYLLKSQFVSFYIPVSRSFSRQSLQGLLN
ncbi:LytR/AlgR family response regulator transcription factor [Polaribacter aquimarinus]|uniref:HTH LytTR-type domain-containing protein n=1 Tax=Polaribacter aquimarinus TaxID=2100726 RepID=A0A2U2JC90_9FLAO|nr:LytTR family DNA-binding domain-containing protein [Polaribacter aquimarinus]PWG05891.1 hypothetical protein DIS07_05465 [Polaribacter aquimarinus]